jgi:signal transduction histidine kinase
LLAGISHNSVVQALYNIVKNAIEVSPIGGRVTITARMLQTGMEIAVEDEGPGIPIDNHEKVFEPFFTTKANMGVEDSGMGLWISRGIVESLRGTLTLESTVGQGTTLRLFLPHGTQAS